MDTKCPYCGEELTKGFLKSGRDSIAWINDDASFIKKYTFLGGEPIASVSPVPAYRCFTCKKVILDIIKPYE